MLSAGAAAPAVDQATLEKLIEPLKAPTKARHISETLEEMIARRSEFLTAYQKRGLCAALPHAGGQGAAAEAARTPGKTALTQAVARYAFKLMAIKDEYEVARLYTDGSFQRRSTPPSPASCAMNFISRRRCWPASMSTPASRRKCPCRGFSMLSACSQE